MSVLRAGGGAGLGDAGLGVRKGIKSRSNLENIIARVATATGIGLAFVAMTSIVE